MRKKLILFDWGNIVDSLTTGYTCNNAWEDLFSLCGYKGSVPAYKIISKYRVTTIKDEVEFKKVYEEMQKEFSLHTSYEEFASLYLKIFSKVDYYQEVADFEVSLKDKCYIGILSNLTIFDRDRLEKQLDLSKYDYVFLSYEFGLRKPDVEIYEEVSKRLPFRKEDILFIDDREVNIESAKKWGWNVLQATGLELDKIRDVCNKFISE